MIQNHQYFRFRGIFSILATLHAWEPRVNTLDFRAVGLFSVLFGSSLLPLLLGPRWCPRWRGIRRVRRAVTTRRKSGITYLMHQCTISGHRSAHLSAAAILCGQFYLASQLLRTRTFGHVFEVSLKTSVLLLKVRFLKNWGAR